MKKYALILAASIFILISSCKEVPPFINFEEDVELLKDTTYISSPVPAAQDLNVLIEDISGVRCVNCPDAAKVAHELFDNNPGRVFVTTIHPRIIRSFTTPYDSGYDFRTDEGNNIVKNLIGEPLGLPAGAINRTKFPNETFVSMSERNWTGYVNQLTTQKSEVNMDVDFEKDSSKRTVKATVKTVFTKQQSDPMYMSIFVTESHIINPQLTSSGKQKDYEHNFILRKAITPYNGVKLADNITDLGRTFEKGVEFEIDSSWNYKNCHVVITVNRFGENNKEVLQVNSFDLK